MPSESRVTTAPGAALGSHSGSISWVYPPGWALGLTCADIAFPFLDRSIDRAIDRSIADRPRAAAGHGNCWRDRRHATPRSNSGARPPEPEADHPLDQHDARDAEEARRRRDVAGGGIQRGRDQVALADVEIGVALGERG